MAFLVVVLSILHCGYAMPLIASPDQQILKAVLLLLIWKQVFQDAKMVFLESAPKKAAIINRKNKLPMTITNENREKPSRSN